MPATYEPIATTTLGSAAADITFSSIPATYTDLRLVIVATCTISDNMRMQLNGDTASNYSRTALEGDGSTAASNRTTNISILGLSTVALSTTIPTLVTADFFSYAGSTNKTVLVTNSQDYNGSGEVGRIVGLWRSTSAITSIKFYMGSGNLATGTTATLYGILKA
jgi:hypothetical protein